MVTETAGLLDTVAPQASRRPDRPQRPDRTTEPHQPPAAPGRSLRIAMVSEHASPLAAPGTPDAGGQNVHVDALARALGRLGHTVTVYTRRDAPSLPDRVPLGPGAEVVHVDAGPRRHLPKEQLAPHMDELGEGLAADWRRTRPDVVHAHYWMSGLACLTARRSAGAGGTPDRRPPLLQTFHALAVVRRRHLGEADGALEARLGAEQRLVREVDGIVATCQDEAAELGALGASPDRISVVPCGVDLERFTPRGPVAPRPPGRYRLLVVGRLVARKGALDVLRALPHVPDADLVVAGGPEADELA
ncbi:MAG TPA: glycosyltransferase, partial [Acidimicrobiales bacterium]|nr:glycosyltransferase [Acidimicrobiales bacterium]